MWREVLRVINNATVDGLAQGKAPATHEQDFYRQLRHANEVFAAFKVHSMAGKMAERMLTPDGRLKTYSAWLADVKGITAHHVGAWLRTEYDTAVIRAHNAADWRQFIRDKDIMPNLRWMPTTSPAPEGLHREFWQKKLTLPVEHPFWEKHHPGDRWNCKCSLQQTDEPPTPELIGSFDNEKPQRGLENNPGHDGHIFNDTHPYFPASCASCGFYRKAGIKNRLLGNFTNRRKDCYNCPYIDGCIDRAKGLEEAKQKVLQERKDAFKLLPTQPEVHDIMDNLITNELLRSKKVLKRFLNHCQSLDELDAAKYIWLNPENLKFVKNSPMGEGKDLSDPMAQKNIKKKRERGITSYNLYTVMYDKRKWNVKLEVHEDGFEQMYFLREQ